MQTRKSCVFGTIPIGAFNFKSPEKDHGCGKYNPMDWKYSVQAQSKIGKKGTTCMRRRVNRSLRAPSRRVGASAAMVTGVVRFEKMIPCGSPGNEESWWKIRNEVKNGNLEGYVTYNLLIKKIFVSLWYWKNVTERTLRLAYVRSLMYLHSCSTSSRGPANFLRVRWQCRKRRQQNNDKENGICNRTSCWSWNKRVAIVWC